MKSIAEVVCEFIAVTRQLSWLVAAEEWLRVQFRDWFDKAGQRIHVASCGAGDTAYLPVSPAYLPNFYKSRSNVSRLFFERTSAIFSIAVACSPNRRVIT